MTTSASAPSTTAPPSTVDHRVQGSRGPQYEGRTFEARLMAPALILLAVLSILPFLFIVVTSFMRIDLIQGLSFEWTGFANWSNSFADSVVRASWVRGITYFLATVGLEMALGIGVALVLWRLVWGRNLVLSAVLLPMFIAPVIVGLIGRFMFDSTFGLYAWVLESTGLYASDVFANPTSAFVTVILLDVWEWTPLIALIALAGFTSVSPDTIEAAQVDGATFFQRLRHVVFPQMTEILLVALLIRAMDAIRYFDIIWVTTNGGPANATKIIPIRLYEIAFKFFDFGYAAVIGLMMLVFSIIVANVFIRILKRQGLAT